MKRRRTVKTRVRKKNTIIGNNTETADPFRDKGACNLKILIDSFLLLFLFPFIFFSIFLRAYLFFDAFFPCVDF